jgi:hypothetical protein
MQLGAGIPVQRTRRGGRRCLPLQGLVEYTPLHVFQQAMRVGSTTEPFP